MPNADQVSEFLRKADDADARVAAATDPFIRAEWARIAMGYRDLAHALKTAAVTDKPSDRPMS